MKLQEVNFQKSQKLLASRAGSSKQTNAGIEIEIEIEWIAIECSEQAASMELARWAVFGIFEKISFHNLTKFFSFLTRENLVFFRYSY